MKDNKFGNILLIVAMMILGRQNVLSQGNFQNLDFEAANIPTGTPAGGFVSTNAAIPGWSASMSPIVYDGVSTGGAAVTINDANSVGGIKPLQGNYSVILWGGTGTPVNYASISQTGLVPANAQSILIELSTLGFPVEPFVVALNGQSISMSPLQTFPNYTEYGGNISAYANQEETLSITQYLPTAGPAPAALEVDDIQFSPDVIPEPQAWTLLLCGAGALSLWRWKRTQ